MRHCFHMPKVYSYTRFSTPEQAAGDSTRRQSEAALRWAKQKGLELDGTLSLADKGVSAYRGGNVEEDRGLGAFLFACRQGLIDKGSYLLVESLDRISRMTPRKVQRLLDDIVDNGVTIVTLNDGQEYTEERLNNDPTALLIALMVSWRAHEESKTKGRRVAAAWAEKQRRVREGSGELYTRRLPAWLRWDGSTFSLNEERAEVVRRVYRMTIEGVGEHRIAEALNREGVAPLWRGRMWHRSAVARLLRSPTVIGTIVPLRLVVEGGKKRHVPEEPIPNAYPAVIPLEDWHTVRAIKDGSTVSRRGRGARPPLANIFSGLARCPDCGANMTRVTKGKRRKAKLVCSNAKVAAAAHPYVSVDQEELESAFKSSWQALLADVPAGDAGGTLDVICRDLEGAVFATEDKLERMAGDYERRPSSILAAKLQAVEAELSSLRESLAETEERRAIADGGLIHARLGQLPDVMEAEGGERAPINAVLRSLFAGVTIDHAAGLLRFAWKQGGESVIVYAMPDASHEAEVLSHAA